MNDLNKISNNENFVNNCYLTSSSAKEISKDKYQNLKPNLFLLKLNNINNNNLSKSKLPLIKPNSFFKKREINDNYYSQNNSRNYLALKTEKKNDNFSNALYKEDMSSNNYLNAGNKENAIESNEKIIRFKTQLNLMKEDNEKCGLNSHQRNLELIKKLMEKKKKEMEFQNEISNRKEKSPMERFDLFKKKSKLNNGLSAINHKKLDPIAIKRKKNIDDNVEYYYKIIYGGNSSETIEECLKRRSQWKKLPEEENHINHKTISSNNDDFTENNHNNYFKNNFPNFLWSHCSNKIDFREFCKDRPSNIKRVTNHFEFHYEISNKLNMFINMLIFCETNNYDLFSMIPVTFPIDYQSCFFPDKISYFSNIFNNINKYISDNTLEYKYRDLFELEFRGKAGYKTSFHIPKNHYSGRNLWLIKAINLNRGRCIKISDNLNDIKKIIKNFYSGVKIKFDKEEDEIIYEDNKEKEENINEDIVKRKLPILKNDKKISNNIKINGSSADLDKDMIKEKINNKIKTNLYINQNISDEKKNSHSPENTSENQQNKNNSNIPKMYKNNSVIIQKYIEKPLCYKGRKCDMRLWVLLTWDFNFYLFKEGHFKASSVIFDINNQNPYVHLTNYSVQKYNQNFEKFEKGNEISFNDFESSLDNKINVRKDLLPKVKDIIKYTMKCVKNKINRFDKKLCFEIFGYDFMFDIDCNPYLLEINTNPGLEISSPLIEMLIPRLIDDAFKLTIDKVFLISQNNLNKMAQNPLRVEGYDDNENMWEFLGSM